MGLNYLLFCHSKCQLFSENKKNSSPIGRYFFIIIKEFDRNQINYKTHSWCRWCTKLWWCGRRSRIPVIHNFLFFCLFSLFSEWWSLYIRVGVKGLVYAYQIAHWFDLKMNDSLLETMIRPIFTDLWENESTENHSIITICNYENHFLDWKDNKNDRFDHLYG